MQKKSASSVFSGKTVLITGGTGSFGKAFAKNLLENEDVTKVIIFSRDELKQWQMREEYPIFHSPKVRYFLGDIRDKDRLRRAFCDVDYVVHAAALKQVPAAEYNPTEFIKTNVLGAMNIIEAALDVGVKKVVGLSTDKAVNPVNLYGATKLCSDKLLTAANSYAGKRGYPIFSVVRYGNVLGSRGSLLPHWNSLLQHGAKELPVTDERMTRFWVTLEQAVDFVKMVINTMEGGEVFIPKIPSFRIVDLAKVMAPKLGIKICGIRPGEKIHEILLSKDDASHSYESENCYIIAPYFTALGEQGYTLQSKKLQFTKVPQDFMLSSDHNPLFLTSENDIKTLIGNYSPCVN